MFGFEQLEVWEKAIELADDAHLATREFPDFEKVGWANQMRRPAVSVSSNIAEGSSRSSNKDFIRFVEIACGSVMELVSQLHIPQRQSFIETQPGLLLSLPQADEVARMLSGLQSSLERKS